MEQRILARQQANVFRFNQLANRRRQVLLILRREGGFTDFGAPLPTRPAIFSVTEALTAL